MIPWDPWSTLWEPLHYIIALKHIHKAFSHCWVEMKGLQAANLFEILPSITSIEKHPRW